MDTFLVNRLNQSGIVRRSQDLMILWILVHLVDLVEPVERDDETKDGNRNRNFVSTTSLDETNLLHLSTCFVYISYLAAHPDVSEFNNLELEGHFVKYNHF